MRASHVDTLIVGGGSAGCVLASRLSEDPARTVLLIEAGPDYHSYAPPPILTNPDISGGDDHHDWGSWSEADEAGHLFALRRGKVLGGSSATNAAVAILPRPADLDRWREREITGWSFDEIRPSMDRMLQTFPVRQPGFDSLTLACQAFIVSAGAIGLPFTSDWNVTRRKGAGAQPRNVVASSRVNAALAYLPESVRSRRNLKVLTGIEADRVLCEGARAFGILAKNGESLMAGEVILSAGVYGSPAILMRSGIGRPAELVRLGIPVRVDLPVGRRLMDQPLSCTIHALKPKASAMIPAIGALACTQSASARENELDLQVFATHLTDPKASPTGSAIVLAAAVTSPDATGTVSLSDALQPRICSNFLGVPRDRERMHEAIALARRIAETKPLRDMIDCEMTAGDEIPNLRSYHHGCSTVPMGEGSDPWAVVDTQGRVRGVERLRVVDASVLPTIPSAPPHLLVLIVAEEIARRIGS